MDVVLVGQADLSGHRNTLFHRARAAERDGLAKALGENGFLYSKVSCEWPRDSFTRSGRNVYSANQFGNYADGGYVLTPGKMAIAGADVSLIDDRRVHSSERRIDVLKSLYGSNVHIVPSPLDSWNENISPHPDLVLLPILQRQVMYVDKRYHQEFRRDIDKLAFDLELKLLEVDQNWAKPSYPCNSLLLEGKDFGVSSELVLVANSSGNERFLSEIKDLGIKVIDVPFSKNCSHAGGVHCATNTIEGSRVHEIEHYLVA